MAVTELLFLLNANMCASKAHALRTENQRLEFESNNFKFILIVVLISIRFVANCNLQSSRSPRSLKFHVTRVGD